MVKSMTGYGKAQNETLGLIITVEIRSVNNRYFDCSVRLPRTLNSLDEPIKSFIKTEIMRGKVEVFLTMEASSGNVTVSLNRDVLNAYINAATEMSEDFGLKYDLSVSGAMRMPDVFTLIRDELDEDALTSGVLSIVKSALSKMTEMREREGSALEADILSRIDKMKQMIDLIGIRAPQIVEEYRLKLERKMNELLGDASVEQSRIVTEAAVFAERIAVDEEIVRLASHIHQVRSLMEKGGEAGRKLDFLIQEMNREVNTIGSKISDTEISLIVIELKSQLEKIREQTQNLE